MAQTQQAHGKKARQSMINARRGINTPVTSRSNSETPLHVRVGGSGAIVRGLRSDQLLLNKMRQGYIPTNPPNSYSTPHPHQDGGNEKTGGRGPVVSLTSQHGLTVSIKNNIAGDDHFSGYRAPGPRNKPRLSRNKGMQQHPDGGSFSATTFTVVNDRVQPVEPVQPVPPSPEPLRRPLKRNFVMSSDPRTRTAAPHHSENIRPIPEAHRQILDPKVQKEIAMLQGKGEVVLNNGPGPGVKGLRHIPTNTVRSLNERFTEERMVTD
ncbi:hypothetical protein Pmani_001682 [Petrolisthes manimaculis]|uniref:Uncharacterized protein n=1 Tax=Petrolisthes manimaculis TaxID=1843537 RepID=A0AAE1URB3_9EUCA|nr:hypothetical protein Pmani_001682 [Petrolisthes manimaculis]